MKQLTRAELLEENKELEIKNRVLMEMLKQFWREYNSDINRSYD